MQRSTKPNRDAKQMNRDSKIMKFSIATFNVRGLTQEYKQEQLSRDITNYNIDICSIQELKIDNSTDTVINNDNRLICFPTGENKSHGNGFIVAKKWSNQVNRYWKVTDRICVLELLTEKSIVYNKGTVKYRAEAQSSTKIKLTKENEADHTVIIINVYAPTSNITKKDKKELRKLYDNLNKLLSDFKKLSTKTVIITGDFNSQVGKSTGAETCLGKYSKGVRNNNGEALINFCESNGLFICNSAFQHPAKHITTWTNRKKDPKTGKMISIYHQIDYIIMYKEQARTLLNARAYAGTETTSDHKLVKSEFEVNWVKLYRKQSKGNKIKYFNTNKLIEDVETRKNYQVQLDREIQKMRREETVETGETWNKLQTVIKQVAENVVGYKEKSKHNKFQDDELEIMSKQQKDLRLVIENTDDVQKVDEMKKKRKSILIKMKEKVKKLEEDVINRIIDEVESARDDAKMFKATKWLNKQKIENPFVHDVEGRNVTNKQAMYNIINKHFKNHFYKEDLETLTPFKEEPKKLQKPFTQTEVSKTIKMMNNNKAPGKDNIPVELIKYAPISVHHVISTALNNIFEKHERTNIGEGILLPLPKPPPKPKVPVTNLRPITLLNISRKILSRMTTLRIEPKINQYLSPSQSAYRRGRSTTDVIWAYRWIIAKVQEYKLKINVIGIDMSSAFDTINRQKLMEILDNILGKDEVRIIRTLLSNPTLEVKVEGAKTEAFGSNTGSPQGDSASGPLFEIYFENALKEVRRAVTNHKNTYNIKDNTSLPDEIIYADDCDFFDQTSRSKKIYKRNSRESSEESKLNSKHQQNRTHNIRKTSRKERARERSMAKSEETRISTRR